MCIKAITDWQNKTFLQKINKVINNCDFEYKVIVMKWRDLLFLSIFGPSLCFMITASIQCFMTLHI